MNILSVELDESLDEAGFRHVAATVRPRLEARRIGASVYQAEAGVPIWPYHYHHGNEELLIVVAGTPTVRTPDGERVLEPGDCLLFPRGPDGGHTFWNDSDEPTRVLMMSTRFWPEIVNYPDSGKLGASSPFGRGRYLVGTEVEYWEGEQ